MNSALRCIANQPKILLTESSYTLKEIKEIHTQLVINGLLDDPQFLGKFIATIALSKPEFIAYSSQILAQSHSPNVFTLNTMIRAYSKSPTPNQGFQFYNRMLRSRLSPDNYTFTFLVRSCAHISSGSTGLTVHGAVIKRGFESDPHVQSVLIHMYSELGHLNSSYKIYYNIPYPDLVTQTAMVSVSACSGEMDFARSLFDEMPHLDPVAWNAMIAGYVECGKCREALDVFSLMQFEGARVNEVTLVSVLSACSHLGALDQGKWVHLYIEKNKLQMNVTLGTALIDMYSKCGNMTRAMEVFWRMRDKNVFTWSSAMGGLAMNGAGEKCLELFSLMKQEGVLPNHVTFVSILRGCSVAGLVKKGEEIFNVMTNEYGLEPWVEHYGCMVDLYGRAGKLDDAVNFINNMPIKPHVGAWGALLNACRIHKHTELGKFALSKIVELEADNDGAYVLLSNIYADSKNWDGVSNVRKLMKVSGVRKEPGCSVIEVCGEVHEFFVGDKTHPRYGEIELMWEEICKKLRLAGYVPNTEQVLFDIEEEEKEDALFGHSEKLAIAFGFISLDKLVPIRIVKNLRVCRDCHDVTKMISRVFDREIIVRDRNRFHHFKNGHCSCMDFW